MVNVIGSPGGAAVHVGRSGPAGAQPPVGAVRREESREEHRSAGSVAPAAAPLLLRGTTGLPGGLYLDAPCPAPTTCNTLNTFNSALCRPLTGIRPSVAICSMSVFIVPED